MNPEPTDPEHLPLAVVAGAAVRSPPPRTPPMPAAGPEIAEFVAQRAAGCVGADYANLALVDAGRTSVRVYHSSILDNAVEQLYVHVPIEAPFPIVQAIRIGQSITLDGEADYLARFPGIWPDTKHAGIESTVSIPLARRDGSQIGAMGFAWRSSPVFEVKLDRALHAVALLVTEIVERAERYDAEHEMIADLHQRLISELPEVAGLRSSARYLPSGRSAVIGGDWYEGLLISPHTLAIVVGDVVGHGLAAAADMALIRGMITALIHDGVTVGEVFVRVSRVLERRPENVLATAAIVLVDMAAASLTYSTAGHPPPLLVRPDGSTMLLDDANSPMLGVRLSRPVSKTVPFPAGSQLIMYTDGLVERRDRPFFEGIDELVQILSHRPPRLDQAESIDQIIHTLAGENPADDIAIVLIENTGTP